MMVCITVSYDLYSVVEKMNHLWYSDDNFKILTQLFATG